MTEPVAVNVSARSLHDRLIVDDVGEALQTHGLDPARLQIEITESALMAMDDAGIDKLEAMYVGSMSPGLFAAQEHIGSLLADYLGQAPIPVGEVYLPGDPPRMFAAMRATGRPCLAFKILAAGRLAGNPVREDLEAGAALAGAAKVATEIDHGEIVFVVCDGGWKYLSEDIWTRDLDADEEEVDSLNLW